VSDESLDGPPGASAELEQEPEVSPGPEQGSPVDPKDIGLLKDVLEALVFVHRGILPPKTVREVLGEEFTAEEIAAGFAALRADHEARGGALVLVEVAGGWQFGTRTDLAPWIKKLDFYEHHRHLSRPTMETLAIIAYKQPVTRAEIEAIRGVNVERIVRNLLERKLVKILGHKDVPGKPMVLGTTREFLELFGLNSLAGLPPLKDFVEPPSSEGIDEEPPLPVFTGDGGGNPEEITPAAAATIEQEAEHGSELETGDGEPDDPDAPGDGDGPADDTNEAG
jgi:segregation and condensation protein B